MRWHDSSDDNDDGANDIDDSNDGGNYFYYYDSDYWHAGRYYDYASTRYYDYASTRYYDYASTSAAGTVCSGPEPMGFACSPVRFPGVGVSAFNQAPD